MSADAGERHHGDDYVTSGEAARILHVSTQTLRRWARDGRVPSLVTMGGHHRFSRSEMERLANRHTVNGRPGSLPPRPEQAPQGAEPPSSTPEP